MPGRLVRFAFAAWSAVPLLCGCVEADEAAYEQGVVLAAIPASQSGENTNALAVAGLVAGAAVGARFGGQGAGQVIASLAGAAVGSAAGTAAEAAAQPKDGIAYVIRLQDGRVLTIVEHREPEEPVFAPGATIRLRTRGRTQHVIAAT